MVSKTKKKDLGPVARYVNEIHEGNLLWLTMNLDRAIYMLHYIPQDDSFSAHQRQNVCFALLGLRESLMEVFFNQHNVEYSQWQ